MNAQTAPLAFAGIPVGSWMCAVRIWLAVVASLYAAFWLQLDAASSAAVTVAILALPTRGQALEKASFRVLGTIIGVATSIAIVGMFSQTRDLLLVAFAAWVGMCVYAAGLLDGSRAYAAVLSGYTVALVAMTKIDTPHQVFDGGVQRGAAIAVGIGALAIVNDLLVAPDRHPSLVRQLADLHRRIRDYAKAAIRNATSDAAAVTLLRDIAALRSDITGLVTESSSGPARSAAARATVVAMVAELHAARVLNALPAADRPIGDCDLIPALEGDDGELLETEQRGLPPSPSAWASASLLNRDREVRDSLSALKAGLPLSHARRMPFNRCHRLAANAGIRAALWLVLPSVFLVVTGWPSTDFSLALVAVIIGLGAISPNPRALTLIALIAMPGAVAIAGILQFLVLDGASQFPLLALALAPMVVGAGLLMTRPNPVLASIGRLNLIFILVILNPSNPQTYDPQSYLFTSLFVCLAVILLLASQFILPPLSDTERRQGLIAAARREFERLPKVGRYLPEEAMFRDVVRIGQIAATAIAESRQDAVLNEALALFDRAGIIRLCDMSLTALAAGPAASQATQARQALAARDVSAMRRTAVALQDAATEDARAAEAGATLHVASFVLEGKKS